MRHLAPIEPIDYLVIGHITRDLTPTGPKIGGTASYAALTARALGLRVGILTAGADDLDLATLEGITVSVYPSLQSTTFENIATPNGRIQYLHHRADVISAHMVPETWLNTPIVHLGPVDQEIDPNLVRLFPNATLGITPQGWMRSWDENKRVHFCEWPESAFVLQQASAAVLSIEDVEGNEELIEDMIASARILVVTEGKQGARLYWNGDLRRFTPPQMEEVDSVGAGDIFATCFFTRLNATRDPWEAARFATQLAAKSVTRRGVLGVPTASEVREATTEIIWK